MNKEIRQIMKVVHREEGRAYFVGGCVRDYILGVKSKDIDVEVFGLSIEQLATILRHFGKVDLVGKSFGVIKLTTLENDYDFTLPRKDNKVGSGHNQFEVEVDHMMTPYEAAKRRDYTINSMSMDVNGNLIDPFNGQEALNSSLLIATSGYFKEDALRVLRGMQFAGRFNMEVSEPTAFMCEDMKEDYGHLSLERIREEWTKWALKSVKPSMGLQFLVDTNWIPFYPELDALVGLSQDAEYHPEGCVFTHTGMVCDEAVKIADRENLNDEDRLILVLSALCHDLGKSTTTTVEDGRIKSPRHAQEGKNPTISLLTLMGFGDKIIEKVVPLVLCHMDHLNFEV
jgi:tRNA nucleotidyltransferase (CCA-adding enzyme)